MCGGGGQGAGVGPAAHVTDAGGEMLMPATDMGQMVGVIGHFKDSEGNRIGLQSP